MSLKRLLPVLLLALPLCAQQPGETTERVVTAKDANQSYALYLPSKYTPKQQWPVLFVFDPDARGKLGVETFRDAAEKHGYIVAASNNSKNGPRREQAEAAAAMMDDVQHRFALDSNRIFAAGFSGGARMAGLVGFLCHNCVKAVISCGAGFPDGLDEEHKKQLPAYFFTVGQYDFNYFDVMDSARALQAPAAIAVFDGVHQWPPADVAMQAIAWTAAGASERKVPPATPAEAAQRKRQMDLFRPIATALARAQQPQQPSVPTVLGDTSDSREGSSSDPFEDAKREMAALRKKREQATGDDLVVYRRALGLAFANAAETAQQLEREKKFQLAATYYEVAAAGIAPNPYLTYNIASAWAAAGNKKKALAQLKQAVTLGFHDPEQVNGDHRWDALRSNSDLKAILGTMR